MTKTIEILRRERERRKLKFNKILWTKLENGKLSYAWYTKLSKKGEPLGLGRWNWNIEFVIFWSSSSTSNGKIHTNSTKRTTKTVTFVCFFFFFPCTIFLYCALHIVFMLSGISFLLFSHETPIHPFWRSSHNNPIKSKESLRFSRKHIC